VYRFVAACIVVLHHFSTCEYFIRMSLLTPLCLCFFWSILNIPSVTGEGAIDLANAVKKACQSTKKENFKFLYSLTESIKSKIETIAKEMYGAASVSYSPLAEEQITRYTQQGFGNLPICMAKLIYL
jgi:formyltetrahydrofolate synthetase